MNMQSPTFPEHQPRCEKPVQSAHGPAGIFPRGQQALRAVV
jgi:hypothetical protein